MRPLTFFGSTVPPARITLPPYSRLRVSYLDAGEVAASQTLELV